MEHMFDHQSKLLLAEILARLHHADGSYLISRPDGTCLLRA
jgi:hypothetical protein